MASGTDNQVRSAVCGEYLYTPQSRLDPQTAFVIISGEVKVVLSKADGNNTPIISFGPRSIIPRYQTINGKQASLGAQASKPTSYIVTSFSSLNQSTGSSANFSNDLVTESINAPSLTANGQEMVANRGIHTGIAPETLLHVQLPAMDDPTTYLYPKEITCPSCGQKFESIQIRRSKLKTYAIEEDSRVRYREFEPMRYSVIVCPHCVYANSATDFDNLSEVAKSRLQPFLKEYADQKLYFYPYTKDEEIFAGYYQAINCLEKIGGIEAKVARMWLNLSWLYDDAGETEASDSCCRHALSMFEKSFYNTSRETTVEQDQRFNLMLGHLYLRNNNPKLAAKHYYAAIKRHGGTKVLNDIAEDKVHLAKEAARKMAQESGEVDENPSAE
jgi:uncharacterized protein (DUF2225 family)